MILAATARLVAAQHTPYAHPATPEAACLERFLHYDYGTLGRQIARLQSPVEWSTSLLEADPGARGLLVLPEESFDDAPPPAVAVALLEFTRRTLALLNGLNQLLLLEHGAPAGGDGERPPQVSSAELTFRLRSRPEPYLLLHCDHEEHDPTTAVFTVGLSHGSQLSLHVRPGASVLYVRATRTSLLHAVRTRGAGQLAPRRHALYVRGTRTSLGRAERTMYRGTTGSHPTVLSGWPNTTASDARCRAASDGGGNVACASDRAGAATYLPLHACHSRPVGTAPRDVVAIHVRWTTEPPAAVAVGHMVHALARRCEDGDVASYCSAPHELPHDSHEPAPELVMRIDAERVGQSPTTCSGSEMACK